MANTKLKPAETAPTGFFFFFNKTTIWILFVFPQFNHLLYFCLVVLVLLPKPTRQQKIWHRLPHVKDATSTSHRADTASSSEL
ncbi:hypothetical protein ACN38_g12408 [Penicillium nordicum]|uniref:Uncharacterized protein n=1 Tax=Penicillium nordicum TaxID=229535 RepID=A0A0N0RXH7_9EURO|nr:hypothetical protein ACN38_g12408 [Penicillium nordicum]